MEGPQKGESRHLPGFLLSPVPQCYGSFRDLTVLDFQDLLYQPIRRIQILVQGPEVMGKPWAGGCWLSCKAEA